jgi:sodium/proline symporter
MNTDRIDRIDRMVAVCFVAMLVALVGMLFDVWRLVYYAIPVLTVLFMLMGALDKRDEWRASVVAPVAAFGGVLLVLFAIADAVLYTDVMFGGLPAATGTFLYVIWPVATVGGSLLFAWVYQAWLRHDLSDLEETNGASARIRP